MQYIGRKTELSVLRSASGKGDAVLTAIYGRRRVGKTALVEEAYKNNRLWKFEGIENCKSDLQIQLFLKELERYTDTEPISSDNTWQNVFSVLNKCISETERLADNPLIIFFDEFQWMCQMKTELVSLFKYFWDNYFSKHQFCHFILCGSVSSFIVKKVLRSKALYGRIRNEIDLKPLSIPECKQFFGDSIIGQQLLDAYMTIGGVPQYLLELEPNQSLSQNINRLAFHSSGYFFREFDRLFISHFSKNIFYEKAIQALSSGKMDIDGISSKCDMSKGGTLSSYLLDLELAGFIQKQTPLDKKLNSRIVKYSIFDEFLHFYFSFIEPNSKQIIAGNASYDRLANNKYFMQWQGYAFERMCTKHFTLIAAFLGFSGINYQAGPWFRKQTDNTSGAQIDLLFSRSDNVITICEIKNVNALQLSVIRKEMEIKKACIQHFYPNQAIETVLVLKNNLSNQNSLKTVFNQIILAEALFEIAPER